MFKYFIVSLLYLFSISLPLSVAASDLKGDIRLGKVKNIIYYKNEIDKNYKINRNRLVINTEIDELKEICIRANKSIICVSYGHGKVYRIETNSELLADENFEKKLKERLDKSGFKPDGNTEIEIAGDMSNVYSNGDYIYSYVLKGGDFNYLVTTESLNKEMIEKDSFIKNTFNEKLLNESFKYFNKK